MIKKKVADLVCNDTIGQLKIELNNAQSVRAKLRYTISSINSSYISGRAPLSAYSKEMHNIMLLNERIAYLEGEIKRLRQFQIQLFPQEVVEEQAPIYGEPCEEEIPYNRVAIANANKHFLPGTRYITTEIIEKSFSVYNIRNKLKEDMSDKERSAFEAEGEQYHTKVLLVGKTLTSVEKYDKFTRYRQLGLDDYDIFDIGQIHYELNKYDLKLYLSADGFNLRKFKWRLEHGFNVKQTIIHTAKTIETGMKQLHKLAKEQHRKEMVPASYFGSDTEYPMYYGEQGTVYIYRAYAVHLPQYLLKDGAYIYLDGPHAEATSLVPKGFVHSTQVLDIRFMDNLCVNDIQIKNLRNEQPTQPWQVRVDRASVLGNPFKMEFKDQRDEVCDMYEAYLEQKVADKDPAICNELNRLLSLLEKYNKLDLFCWCAPKRCHAESIRKMLFSKINSHKLYNTIYVPDKAYTDVVYTTWFENKGEKTNLGSAKSNATFYEDNVTYIREISKPHNGKFMKSHKMVDPERIKALEILTGVSLRKTVTLKEVTDLEDTINYYIQFNNSEDFYHWDEAEKITNAYRYLQLQGLKMESTLQFIHEPVLARYFEDTNSGASRDVTGDSEYSDYRETNDSGAEEVEESEEADEDTAPDMVDVEADVDDSVIESTASDENPAVEPSHVSINVDGNYEYYKPISIKYEELATIDIPDNIDVRVIVSMPETVAGTPKYISSFKGTYLSNMWPCIIRVNKQEVYSCVEAAYQAAKCLNPADRMKFIGLNGYEAKKLGRQIQLRPNWDQVKLGIMEKLLRLKFSKHSLKQRLLNTGNATLVEGNNWNDTFWGVCNGKGQNHLGKLLMKIRKDLQK